jgi:integrase
MKLNEAIVAGLPAPAAGAKLFAFPAAVRGFAVRVTAENVRSFVLTYRAGGKQRSYTIGRWHDPWSAADAVREAKELRQRVDRGQDPLGEKQAARVVAQPTAAVLTLGAVLDAFMLGHAQKRLRRPDNHGDAFERLVKPALGSLPITELKRSHIKAMLDGVNGPVMADRTLSYLRSALNWWANEHEDFALPRFAGLRWAGEPAETRALGDHEVRLLWAATVPDMRPEGYRIGLSSFGAAVRFMLLTAQRKGEVFGMTFAEVDREAGRWVIPASRYKTKRAHTVELSAAALSLLEQHRPDWAQREPAALVFASDITNGRLGNGSSSKRMLDRRMAKLNDGVALPDWKVHGLRSTARTLMERAGVSWEIGERVLGHLIGERVGRRYAQHPYTREKREAGEALAAEIARIVGWREQAMAEYVR